VKSTRKCKTCRVVGKLDFYKGVWIHKKCISALEKDKKNRCVFCKKEFTKDNPRISQAKKLHRKCKQMEDRNRRRIENPMSGGKWS